jgi:hypothetical protein
MLAGAAVVEVVVDSFPVVVGLPAPPPVGVLAPLVVEVAEPAEEVESSTEALVGNAPLALVALAAAVEVEAEAPTPAVEVGGVLVAVVVIAEQVARAEEP